MKTIEIAEASRSLSDYAKAMDEDILVVTAYQKRTAALVSLKHVDRESLALSTSPEFIDIIEAARAEFRSRKTFSLEEMKREVTQ